jgi:hypothetical protein
MTRCSSLVKVVIPAFVGLLGCAESSPETGPSDSAKQPEGEVDAGGGGPGVTARPPSSTTGPGQTALATSTEQDASVGAVSSDAVPSEDVPSNSAPMDAAVAESTASGAIPSASAVVVPSATALAMCTPGTEACTGTTRLACDAAGSWSTVEECPYLCVAGQCAGTCAPSTRRCEGQLPQACDGTGTWLNDGAPCEGPCEEGVCQGACTAGTTQCVSATELQTCGADDAWGSVAACELVCVDGACGGVCQPGATECTSITTARTCGSDGEWGTAVACGNACVDGGCGGTCQPGTTECTSNTTARSCGSDGEWQAAATCANACVDGGCGGVCKPGEVTCASGTALQTCQANGEWSAPSTCTHVCAYDACRSLEVLRYPYEESNSGSVLSDGSVVPKVGMGFTSGIERRAAMTFSAAVPANAVVTGASLEFACLDLGSGVFTDLGPATIARASYGTLGAGSCGSPQITEVITQVAANLVQETSFDIPGLLGPTGNGIQGVQVCGYFTPPGSHGNGTAHFGSDVGGDDVILELEYYSPPE